MAEPPTKTPALAKRTRLEIAVNTKRPKLDNSDPEADEGEKPARNDRTEKLCNIASLREAQPPYRADEARLGRGEKHLRNYQRELAEEGLAGNNCIICAPTGSGKTITAGYICKERRKGKPRFKTLFIVCIRNLINQQASALRELFQGEPQAVEGIGETAKLQSKIEEHDIVVLTAQILVNSLQSGEVNISSIDLLIMDECHHTDQGHAYNNIMRHMHGVSNKDRKCPLPQIIGLTASLGVGKGDRALEHYITMCANLNCKVITSVKDPVNMDELLHHNPKPTKDQIIQVNPRPSNVFSKTIMSLMCSIEGETRFIGGHSRKPKGSQGYTAWVVREQEAAAAVGDARDTIDSCEALNVLNTALEHYEELRAVDVLDLLQDFFDRKSLADDPLPHKENIFLMYYDLEAKLKDFTQMEEADAQPKLGALQNLLYELFSARSEEDSREDPKVLLLTRTIFSTIVLKKFIGESEKLKGCGIKAGRLVGKDNKQYCMTDVQQNKVLKQFKGDGLNLLIATDVAQEGLDIPKCNLLIRYNFVSNEIGSVQAKGRARAQKSKCYLIVDKDSINEKRELENLKKEHKMMDALKQIDKLPKDELHRKIDVEKLQLFEKHLANEERKKEKGTQIDCEDITIVCSKCKAVLGLGSDIVRKGESQYINTNPDLMNRIKVTNFPERHFRHDIQKGVVRCGERSCQSLIGNRMVYKQGERKEGFTMGMKNIMFNIRNNHNLFDPTRFEKLKKWTDVPFHNNIPVERLGL